MSWGWVGGGGWFVKSDFTSPLGPSSRRGLSSRPSVATMVLLFVHMNTKIRHIVNTAVCEDWDYQLSSPIISFKTVPIMCGVYGFPGEKKILMINFL